MKCLGELPWPAVSYNAFQIREYVYCCRVVSGALALSRVRLETRINPETAITDIGLTLESHQNLVACRIGEDVLALAFSDSEIRAFYLHPKDDAHGGCFDIEYAELNVVGTCPEDSGDSHKYIIEYDSDKVLLLGDSSPALTSCTIGEDSVTFLPINVFDPTRASSGCVPTPALGGQLFAMGSSLYSNIVKRFILNDTMRDISVIRQLYFDGRTWSSAVAVNDRTLVVFGGYRNIPLGDLFLFDVPTGKASAVAPSGAWHPAASLAVMAVSGDAIYILGGRETRQCSRISFADIRPTIVQGDVRALFPGRAEGEPESESSSDGEAAVTTSTLGETTSGDTNAQLRTDLEQKTKENAELLRKLQKYKTFLRTLRRELLGAGGEGMSRVGDSRDFLMTLRDDAVSSFARLFLNRGLGASTGLIEPPGPAAPAGPAGPRGKRPASSQPAALGELLSAEAYISMAFWDAAGGLVSATARIVRKFRKEEAAIFGWFRRSMQWPRRTSDYPELRGVESLQEDDAVDIVLSFPKICKWDLDPIALEARDSLAGMFRRKLRQERGEAREKVAKSPAGERKGKVDVVFASVPMEAIFGNLHSRFCRLWRLPPAGN